MTINKEDIKLQCLEYAINNASVDKAADDIIADAEKFYNFVISQKSNNLVMHKTAEERSK